MRLLHTKGNNKVHIKIWLIIRGMVLTIAVTTSIWTLVLFHVCFTTKSIMRLRSIVKAWSEQKSIALLKYYFQSQSPSTHPWVPSSRQNVYQSRLVLIIAINIWDGLWLFCMCVLQQRSPTNYWLNYLGMIRVEIYSFDEI